MGGTGSIHDVVGTGFAQSWVPFTWIYMDFTWILHGGGPRQKVHTSGSERGLWRRGTSFVIVLSLLTVLT